MKYHIYLTHAEYARVLNFIALTWEHKTAGILYRHNDDLPSKYHQTTVLVPLGFRDRPAAKARG